MCVRTAVITLRCIAIGTAASKTSRQSGSGKPAWCAMWNRASRAIGRSNVINGKKAVVLGGRHAGKKGSSMVNTTNSSALCQDSGFRLSSSSRVRRVSTVPPRTAVQHERIQNIYATTNRTETNRKKTVAAHATPCMRSTFSI